MGLKNKDLNAVGVTTNKNLNFGMFRYFLVQMYFLKLTSRRVLSMLKIIIVLYFVPNFSEI